MISLEEVEKKIREALPGAQVRAEDMTGTGDHFEITVISKAFEGKSLIEQHKMIFSILEKDMQTSDIHAVKLKTYAKPSA
jgi:stress-induced morphogen